MARAISKRLGFNPHEESEWERVVAIYSVNTVRNPAPAKNNQPSSNSLSESPLRCCSMATI